MILALLVPFLALSFEGQEAPAKPVSGDLTNFDYSKSRGFPRLLSPYVTPFVPNPRLVNSRRLEDLIVGDKLFLTLDDAIALALENNPEIAVARYDLPIAQTDLLRAKGGGATRGVAGSFQSTSLFAGSLGGGVGSSITPAPMGAGGLLGGIINSVGSARCCDPEFFASYGWSNAITPLNYTVVSGVKVDTTHEESFSAGYSQGFLTGTSVFVSEGNSRLASNTTTGIFNPELLSGLSVGVSQHLLRGFGPGANAKFIRIARNDLKFSMSVFRENVILAVASVMTTYYDLLADQESIRTAQAGLEYSQKLLEDSKAGNKTGPVAEYNVLRSQEEVALREHDLLEAQNTFSQDAQSLKAKITKSFNQRLADVEIAPSELLPEPRSGDVPTLAEALREATAHRPEIEQAQMSLQNQQVVLEATKNALLPALDVYGSYYLSGLGGSLRPTIDNIFKDDFPNFSFGLRLEMPLRNRTAQADSTRALLEQRRLQMRLQDARNVAVWDVSKAVTGVDQARNQLEATKKLVALALQVVEMQHQKFSMELATVEEYITAQQNLAIARGRTVKAHTAYAKALIQYEKATGTLLDRNNIEMADAVHGEVHHIPKVP